MSARDRAYQAGIVVGVVVVATLLRLALHPILHERGVFLLAAIAVAVSAHLCGFWAGIATTVLSLPAALLLFRHPADSANLAAPDWVQMTLFATLAVALSVIGGRLRSTVLELQRSLERERRLHASERAARAEADHANRVKDDFLAILSHELRTPLNAIVGWAHVLKGLPLSAEASGAVATILRNADHQTKLLTDIYDLARVTAGKLVLEPSLVDLCSTLQQVIDAVRLAADARGIRLQLIASEEAMIVRGDATRLHQVFWNLLSNGIKFSPSGALVQVSATREGQRILVRVADSGQGVSPEFLPHVFESFRQEDPSSERRNSGLGLGLAVVRHLVEAHGGTVQAESDGPGKGSVFTVALPVPGRSAGGIAFPDSALPHLDGLRILVVEDNPDALALIARGLNEFGAAVVTSSSAVQARAEISRQIPDVIVSDIGMPEEDGLTFMRALRKRREYERIPAIAVTAYASKADRAEALAAGYQEHIAKPAPPYQIARLIAQLRHPS